jgi:hypothetical protein
MLMILAKCTMQALCRQPSSYRRDRGGALTLAPLLPLSAAALTLVLTHTAHSETSTMAAMAMVIKLRLRFI